MASYSRYSGYLGGWNGGDSRIAFSLIATLVISSVISAIISGFGFLFGAFGGYIYERQLPASKRKIIDTPNNKLVKTAAAAIAIIILVLAALLAALIFLYVPSIGDGNVVCNSSDPAKIMVKAAQVDSTGTANTFDLGTIKVVNLTGGEITNVSCVGSRAFNATVALSDGCTASVASGAEMALTPNASASPGRYFTGEIKISYTDYANLRRSATITCSGPITVD